MDGCRQSTAMKATRSSPASHHHYDARAENYMLRTYCVCIGLCVVATFIYIYIYFQQPLLLLLLRFLIRRVAHSHNTKTGSRAVCAAFTYTHTTTPRVNDIFLCSRYIECTQRSREYILEKKKKCVKENNIKNHSLNKPHTHTH